MRNETDEKRNQYRQAIVKIFLPSLWRFSLSSSGPMTEDWVSGVDMGISDLEEGLPDYHATYFTFEDGTDDEPSDAPEDDEDSGMATNETSLEFPSTAENNDDSGIAANDNSMELFTTAKDSGGVVDEMPIKMINNDPDVPTNDAFKEFINTSEYDLDGVKLHDTAGNNEESDMATDDIDMEISDTFESNGKSGMVASENLGMFTSEIDDIDMEIPDTFESDGKSGMVASENLRMVTSEIDTTKN
ncbi:unnamed protein product [Clonostachys rosea f. rosea IK726]|uniref:Uncharacterized protein n=1 Tax=Clonostachys rosea f. rosea IK726 TaxID=1349383 RepID=A0ACA9UPE8_BIOOC|nr:unnamed protein product [Clonostachys rosea f. rosea IK726]